MKKVLSEQQTYLERDKYNKSSRNVFISGIPKVLHVNGEDTEDATKKVMFILKFIDNSITDNSFVLQKAFPIFKNHEGKEVQSIKITFNDLEVKQTLMKKKVQLRDLPLTHPLKKVFLKNDEPPMTHKENVRLRTKAFNLRQQNTESEIVIKKGILYQDNVKIDEFDINNQIF